MSAGKIRLGNGSLVFACCGGTAFHVGSMHPEMAAEMDADRRRRDEYQAEQARRRSALVGDALASIEINPGYSATLRFKGGATLQCKLVGGEMDGHFDPPGNRSLAVVVKTPEELAADDRAREERSRRLATAADDFKAMMDAVYTGNPERR